MNLVHTASELKLILEEVRLLNKTIGFVPTMGALHEGHLSLVKQAKAICDFVVVSIYVNPTQFNQQSDLDKYPRTIDSDKKILTGYCDLIFNPLENKEVYGDEIILKPYDFEGLDKELEGEFRPGHFIGMANVVSNFFRLVKPSKAFFGLKDFQQYVLVKKMVEIEEYPIEIVGCDIVREQNGLAMSSRNMRLSVQAKEVSSVIFYTLKFCEKYAAFFSVDELGAVAKKMINSIVSVEYLEFREANSLKKITSFKEKQEVFLSFAGYIEEVRLIDNIRFTI